MADEYLGRRRGIEEVDVSGCERVLVTLAGGDRRGWYPIASDDELLELVRRVGARRG